MSVRIMSMVFENQDLSSTEKLIMLALADHANDEGKSIYPSQNRLSKKTGLARGTINKHIQNLLDEKYLWKKGYKIDRSNVLELEINVNKLKIDVGVTEDDTPDMGEGVTENDKGCHPELQGGVTENDTNHHLKRQLTKDKGVKEAEPDLLEIFLKHSQVDFPLEHKSPYKVIKWEKEIEGWERLGVTEKDVVETIKQSDKKRLTLAWPGSITNMLKSRIARRKRGVKQSESSKGISDETFESAKQLARKLDQQMEAMVNED